jgi:preprotein translocase subunit SecA
MEEILQAFTDTFNINLYPHQVELISAARPGTAWEVATGEGKTYIIAALAAKHASEGKCVHVITANDYLVERDYLWLKPFYTSLGITCSRLSDAEDTQVIYGTAKEYTRRYLEYHLRNQPQLYCPGDIALIDEADGVLLDGAREAVIVAHPTPADSEYILKVKTLAHALTLGDDYTIDPITRVPEFTEEGHRRLCELTGIEEFYTLKNARLIHRLHQALVAKDGLKKGKDYTIKDGKVLVLEEASGRGQDGLRWNSGLGQAVDAEEGLAIGVDYVTRHRMNVNEYINTYPEMIAFGGTLQEDCDDLVEIYGLEFHTRKRALPRNVTALDPVWDEDKTARLVDDAIQYKGPVLIACSSPRSAAKVYALLPRERTQIILPGDTDEGAKVERASAEGMITVLTPMSARGIDFQTSYAHGYLLLLRDTLATPRLERQVLGRIGRSGAPGSWCSYYSINDPIFAGLKPRQRKRIIKWSSKAGLHKKLARLFHHQQELTAQNLRIRRKRLIRMDSILGPYRQQYHEQRESFLTKNIDISSLVRSTYNRIAEAEPDPRQAYAQVLHLDPVLEDLRTIIEPLKTSDEVAALCADYSVRKYQERYTQWHPQMEKEIAIRAWDGLWMDYIQYSEEMGDAVWLRRPARLNPSTEYARELREGWAIMEEEYELSLTRHLLRARLQVQDHAGNTVLAGS